MSSIENQKTKLESGWSRLSILGEVAVTFAVVLTVKWSADSAELVGAGSIAIWSGVIVATLLMRGHGIAWRDFGLRLPRGRRAWLINIGLAIVAVVTVIGFFAVLLDPLVTKLGLEDNSNGPDRWAFLLGKPLLFIAYLTGVVWVGAALGEELLMRGFVLNRLAVLFGQGWFGWTVALVVHAAIFGWMHADQGWSGIIGTGLVALIFGAIYLIGKRQLFPLILAHGIVNTIGLTAYYLSDGAIQ